MKKIGITGARGFIGLHIIDALKPEKNVKVFSFDLPEGDLLKPGIKLENFVKNKDVIIHAAAVNRGTDFEIISGNIVSSRNLISAVQKTKSKAKLIFLSSIQAETETIYGKSKKLAEVMFKDFSKRNKNSVVIFRLPNVFGEGCRPFYNSVVATFCHQIANNKKITVHKNSSNKKIKLIYVKNVTESIRNELFKIRKSNFYLKRFFPKNEITVKKLAILIKSFRRINNFKPRSDFEKNLHKTFVYYL